MQTILCSEQFPLKESQGNKAEGRSRGSGNWLDSRCFGEAACGPPIGLDLEIFEFTIVVVYLSLLPLPFDFLVILYCILLAPSLYLLANNCFKLCMCMFITCVHLCVYVCRVCVPVHACLLYVYTCMCMFVMCVQLCVHAYRVCVHLCVYVCRACTHVRACLSCVFTCVWMFIMCVHLCVHICCVVHLCVLAMCVHLWVHVCHVYTPVCTCLWRSKVNIRCLF